MSKKPKIFVPQAVTANDAANGLVVFRAANGAWVGDLSSAFVAETEDSAETLLAMAQLDATENKVVEPYLIDVAREGERLRALKLREAIRAEGPTVGFGLVALSS
ncbi:MAG: DUF2849 domain-containing protein [Alsobacter sp.]